MLISLNQLITNSKLKPTKKVAIAAAEDSNVLLSIEKAKSENFIRPIYIGNEQAILKVAQELNISIDKTEIIHTKSNSEACIVAVKMVSEGKADILMKGLVPTGELLKQVISKEYGLLSGKLLSHIALFETPHYHKVFGLTDAAMNIAPTLDEKAGLIENAVAVFSALDQKHPKVAVLAAVEKVNPKMTATTDAVILTEWGSNGRFKGALVDGPFALDNAISKEAAKHKGITSPVAGDADILLAPDLNSGNILYKSLAFLSNSKCAALVAGAKAPIILTSRADSEETKYLSILLGVALSSN